MTNRSPGPAPNEVKHPTREALARGGRGSEHSTEVRCRDVLQGTAALPCSAARPLRGRWKPLSQRPPFSPFQGQQGSWPVKPSGSC